MTLLRILLFAILSLSSVAYANDGHDQAGVIVATGAPGESEYGEKFAAWTRDWEKAAKAGGARTKIIGQGDDADKPLEELKKAIAAEPKGGAQPLWIVLLGHGTSDGKEPKFNLPGDDLPAADLASWLAGIDRPVVVVCTFSASGAWLKPLSGKGRIVITATKSGAENNFSRFGEYFAKAISDPSADIDKDGQTSVLEAWLVASQQVADFYQNEGRFATEHSLLDDNGDGLGTSPTWFLGVRVIKKPAGVGQTDGLRAHHLCLVPNADERALSPEMRQERDKLEAELTQLRERKASMPEAEYFKALEEILVRIAKVYRGKGT